MSIAAVVASKKLRTRAGLALGFWLVLLSLALPLPGQQVFTAHHVARLRSVTEAVVSPDGTRVAYILGVPRQPLKDEDGPEWAELHVVGETGASRAFVAGQVTVSNPAWTPDGKAISFLAKRGQDKQKSLYVIAVEGGEARRVLAHDSDIAAYSWSPDGKRVAFLAEEVILDAKRKLREKGFSQEVYEEDWRRKRVWVADTSLAEAKPRALELPGSASELHWSPAGPRLAVALAPTPSVDDDLMNRKLHIVDVASGSIVARLENPGKLGQVAWSPNGQHLALLSAADRNDPHSGRLMVGSADGGPLRDLLPGYEADASAIAWKDADTVLFLSDEGVWTTFGEVGRDGSRRKTHIAAGGPVFSRFTFSRDGRAAAFVGQSPRHPSEVFLMMQRDAVPRRLTDSNPWLSEIRFSAQEAVSFKASDGLRLEGILIRPLDPQEGKRYPLILAVHGGPESHLRNGWLTSYSNPGQTAAARGFAVFYPNYRGSTGRGVAFSKMGQGDFAGKEFSDLVDAVDHLVAASLVDRDRVGITGGSYGGYATAWGATYYSHRFAAGVMFVGLSDLVAKTGTTDIPNEMYLVHQRRWPWEAWEFFRERSPIFHAQKARTPLLILHGKDDPRVHPSQSLELYRYLKLMGKAPVRLVYYPGEGHGNRRAASRLDYSLRLLQWMQHYLQGPGGTPPPFELDYDEPKPADQPRPR